MPRPVEGILASQKYSFYLLFTLKFPGMSDETPKVLHYLWECISWISVFLPLQMGFCFLKTVYDRFEIDNIGTLSNIGMQGAWLVCSFITMIIFKLKSKDLDMMINMIEDTFQWRSAKGKTYVDMERHHRYARIVAIAWQIIPTSSVVASLLRPLFKRPVVLPIVVWYPLNTDDPYQFALAYFLQAWAQIIVVCGFAVGSSFFFSFGLMCCGQFNILRCALKNLIFTSGVYKSFPETMYINNEQDSAEYLFAKEMKDDLPSIPGHSSQQLVAEDIENTPAASRNTTKKQNSIPILHPQEVKNYREALKDCVKHHRTLIKLCGMMEDFFHFFAFLRVLELTLQMCFMAFVYVRTADIIVLFFGVLAGVDLFLITYPAEHIRDQNNEVGPSLMKGPWYLVSKHFRNDFSIIMAYSQQQITFTGGKILILNVDRLRQAFTTAFSYYTLLSSFDEG